MITGDPFYKIDTVELPSGTIWVDRYQQISAAQTVLVSINNNLIVYPSSVIVGNSITLSIATPYSWLHKSQYDQLRILANVPGAIYQFYWEDPDNVVQTKNVIFRHDEPPALDFTQVQGDAHLSDTFLMQGNIKLLEV